MKKLLLSLFLMLFAQWACAFSYTMEITEPQIQQRVSAMMPIQVTKSLFTVVFVDPKVRLLQETDEVAVASPLELLLPGGLKGAGAVDVKGRLRYDAAAGEFFLKDPVITEISLKGLPEKYLPKLREVAQLAVEKSLATRPVYRLKDDDLRHKLAKSVLQSVNVANGKVLVVLSVF